MISKEEEEISESDTAHTRMSEHTCHSGMCIDCQSATMCSQLYTSAKEKLDKIHEIRIK